MNIDDVLDAGAKNPTADPEELSQFIDEVITADDVNGTERDIFAAGYMSGMYHAAAIMVKTCDPAAIITEVMAKEVAWESQDLI